MTTIPTPTPAYTIAYEAGDLPAPRYLLLDAGGRVLAARYLGGGNAPAAPARGRLETIARLYVDVQGIARGLLEAAAVRRTAPHHWALRRLYTGGLIVSAHRSPRGGVDVYAPARVRLPAHPPAPPLADLPPELLGAYRRLRRGAPIRAGRGARMLKPPQ